ncbi:transposase IS4 family protein [Candidatus Thiomargarita nelsonii]|uniref:Transposase IS4 family protein n=1 Tax=Candidatus Thiomargarita nelsonii TaxID=1003181 RepID=A0A176RVH1_9GAMM|nr:transposase IS4 family protein [Candidatus Thiomargarita nelsonii]
MNKLKETLSQYWLTIQGSLFPWLKEELGDLTEKQQRLITVLEIIRLEEYLPSYFCVPGRPISDRVAIARAFVAKAAYDMPTTIILLDRLECDPVLRRICGWERKSDIPSESTFSRAFSEFARTELASRVHETLIKNLYQEQVIGHISRDATEIEAREKPVKKEIEEEKPKRKRGRPKKGEEVVKELTRLQRQEKMSLEEMLDDLPKECDVGSKKNSKGYKETWIGYKLHIDTADGQVPISCVLTSASTHDSQAATPLAEITSQRVTNLYDLMDSAYDADEIKKKSIELGQVPIIDVNPRRDKALKEELQAEKERLEFIHFELPEQVRYRERSTSERVNGRLKDEFGGRHVRVRGHAKVFSHLMFGILVVTVDQLVRLVT